MVFLAGGSIPWTSSSAFLIPFWVFLCPRRPRRRLGFLAVCSGFFLFEEDSGEDDVKSTISMFSLSSVLLLTPPPLLDRRRLPLVVVQEEGDDDASSNQSLLVRRRLRHDACSIDESHAALTLTCSKRLRNDLARELPSFLLFLHEH